MKKLGFALIPVFILALALSAAAQEKPITTLKDRPETVKITVSGDIVLDYVYRSGEVTAFTDSISSDPGDPDGENTFEGSFGVRFNVELSDKVNAVIEIGKERVDAGAILQFAGDNQVIWEDIVIREAHLNVQEFLMPELSFQVGIPTWSFDVRGKGSPFAFGPRYSQSFARNVSPIEDDENTLGYRAGNPEELDPMGAILSYKRDALQLDLVFLPMVIEGGAVSDDEALYAVDLWYNLDMLGKDSRIGAILAVSSFGDIAVPVGDHSGSNTAVFTLGGGAVIKPEAVPGLEIYGEVYFQFGTAGKIDVDGGGPLEEEDLDAGGFAFQVGAQYSLGGDLNPWVGANITMVTGDGDDGDDTEVNSFLSYENVGDLLIIENMYFGYDWDTNYFALKFSGGLALSLGGQRNNLELSAILGICKTMEDVDCGPVGSTEDNLGTEFDARLKWAITKQASLSAAVAFLFGSDVLEQTLDVAGDEEEDSAMLYTLGADLKF